ncbi:rod-binding protein [Kiloniella sp.]|uniref:rod-binding protein n=1 Tax=Kiloniella sp. TaxID=1938587 RepID=UPI003B02E027
MNVDSSTYMDGALGNSLAAKASSLASVNPKDEKSAMAAAKEFEAVFISQMLSPMFESLPTDGPMGGGQGERMFRSLMVQEYGKTLSESGGIGISNAVYREIIKLQEV